MKIAIIGAGPSGLVTLKELLAEGHSAVCYEKSPDIGGVFRFDPKGNGVYESTQMTSSTFLSCFSDFPAPKGSPDFFTHRQYIQYLDQYADHFKLRPHIRFNRQIIHIQQERPNLWRVRVKQIATGKLDEIFVNAVAICSGAHQTPYVPEIPELSDYTGTTLHSAYYKDPQDFKDKNVLIIGGGESGSDLAKEISPLSQTCAVSLRRGLFVIPRRIGGYPNDYYTDRILYAAPNWLGRRQQPKNRVLILRAILGFLCIPLIILLCALMAVILLMLVSAYQFLLAEYTLIVQIISALIVLIGIVTLIRYLMATSTLHINEMVRSLRQESKAGQSEQFAVKTEGLITAVNSGRCELKPAVLEFSPTGVIFTDQSTYDADCVIFCTGYQNCFDFLSEDMSDARNLYKNCFHADYANELCFIGIVRPGLGAIPPVAEMQARWFAQVCSGKTKLPNKAKMQSAIKMDWDAHLDRFAVVTERIPYLVDYTSYMDELAELIGCKPRVNQLISHPWILAHVLGAPFAGYQYRLFGPHANPQVVKRAFKNSPTMWLKTIAHSVMWIPYLVALILYRLGFKDFKPHLKLN